MKGHLDYLEGKTFCVVFVKVLDEAQGKVQLQCFRGRASVDRGRVTVIDKQGNAFPVPSTALGNILPNDGTELLQDAAYFVFVRTDDNMDLVSSN